MNKKQINDLTRKFEEKYGTDAILKVAISSLLRLLSKKDIISEEEILQSFIEELEPAIQKLNQKEQE